MTKVKPRKEIKDETPSIPPQDLFLNRDSSWLKFNERVLAQAESKNIPILERVRFLSIFESNQDEFFMKRLGFLKRVQASGRLETAPDHRQIPAILEEIRQTVHEQSKRVSKLYEKEIRPQLSSAGIKILDWGDLSEGEKKKAFEYFQNRVFPVLTPLAVDPSHPFPFISNLSVSLGVRLKQPKSKTPLFARIKIPDVLPSWVRINEDTDKEYRMVRLIDIVKAHLSEFFPERVIESIGVFRATRSADVDQISETKDDLLDLVEEELRQRRLANIVRVELLEGTDPWLKELLLDELGLKENDVYIKSGEINYLILKDIANLGISDLAFPPHVPVIPRVLEDEKTDIFRAIQNQEIMVHHPYQSFTHSVEKFIRQAAHDPKVLAIKLTLYRTDEKSPFIPLLIEAAESGKQVVCVLELKARFDEARNIYWSEMLENAGVHVVYGVVGLKTHSKMALVVRNEAEEFKFYGHLGTGNYNSATARLYTDIGLFTNDPKITTELVEVFNYLTGLSGKKNYKKLLVAPINMKERFVEMIRQEREAARQGQPARIIAKMNSLGDSEMIEELYAASQDGVKIDLIVRGFCCLKPKVKGLSKNIRVISILGRFLEHSRIFYFQSGKKETLEGKVFISSADWMRRNLHNRVEVAVPLESKKMKKRCIELLESQLKDSKQAWELQENGEYLRPKHFDDPSVMDCQTRLLEAKR